MYENRFPNLSPQDVLVGLAAILSEADEAATAAGRSNLFFSLEWVDSTTIRVVNNRGEVQALGELGRPTHVESRIWVYTLTAAAAVDQAIDALSVDLIPREAYSF